MKDKPRLIMNLMTSIIWGIGAVIFWGYEPIGHLVTIVWLIVSLVNLFYPITVFLSFIKTKLDYRREAAQRRRQYELFKAGVKSGLYATDEQVADENRRVIQ